jgi:hypothetical protein
MRVDIKHGSSQFTITVIMVAAPLLYGTLALVGALYSQCELSLWNLLTAHTQSSLYAVQKTTTETPIDVGI